MVESKPINSSICNEKKRKENRSVAPQVTNICKKNNCILTNYEHQLQYLEFRQQPNVKSSDEENRHTWI